MSARQQRLDALVAKLRRAGGPVLGRVLAQQLGISQRTVRDYVAQLQDQAGRPVVISDQLGYRIDEAAYRRYRDNRARTRGAVDTPQRRLTAILRTLAHEDAIDVYDLGDRLAVSSTTVESDLARARMVLREHHLVLRRDRNLVRVEGPERRKRRLLRSLLFTTVDGSGIDVLSGLRAQPGSELGKLHHAARDALVASDISMNEYALGDLLIHLAVAAHRVRSGHPLASPQASPGNDPVLRGGVDALAAALLRVTGATLGDGEREALYDVLLANSRRARAGEEDPVPPELRSAVVETISHICDQFGLDWSDDSGLDALALHIRNLIERCKRGRMLSSPFGRDFKHAHPLIHEMALSFARRLEDRTGVRISEGEVGFLAYHLGTQFQRQLDVGPQVTVTLVVPQYGTFPDGLRARLTESIAGSGIVEALVSDLASELAQVTSDIVVSTIDLPLDLATPVATISPFYTRADEDVVRAAIRAESERGRIGRLRESLIGVLDESLFLHRPTITSTAEAIRLGAMQLRVAGYVEEEFLDDVLDREQRSSTAFGGPFAIPHSLYMDALGTAICVITTDEPIDWDGSPVRLVLMFAVSPDGRATFRAVLDALVEAISRPVTLDRLIAAGGSFDEFRDALLETLR